MSTRLKSGKLVFEVVENRGFSIAFYLLIDKDGKATIEIIRSHHQQNWVIEDVDRAAFYKALNLVKDSKSPMLIEVPAGKGIITVEHKCQEADRPNYDAIVFEYFVTTDHVKPEFSLSFWTTKFRRGYHNN